MANRRPLVNNSGQVGELLTTDTLLSENLRVSTGIGVGINPISGYSIVVGGTPTAIGGSSIAMNLSLNYDPTITTSEAIGYYSSPDTQTGNIGILSHYVSSKGTLTGTVTEQNCFYVLPNMEGATNNYGFRGSIAAGTGRWNVYMDGTASNYFAGRIGIGTSNLTDKCFGIATTLSGATTSYGVNITSEVQSDVTANAVYLSSTVSTAAASFTLTSLRHFQATQSTIGAGSTVTNQIGYYAATTLIGATNNYGFYSNIPSGTGRWNLYSIGTASNYFAGRIGIGNLSLADRLISIGSDLTGATAVYGITINSEVQSDVTSVAAYQSVLTATAPTTFTLSDLRCYQAAQGTIGAGSTVTNQSGFYVGNSLIGATNNYGVSSNIPSGTGRWNIYASGTATNFFAGVTWFGNTSTGLSISTNIINHNGSAGGVIQFNPLTSDGTSACYVAIGRGTNTTGGVSAIIYEGDGTATINHRLFGGTSTVSFLCAASGSLRLGTTGNFGYVSVGSAALATTATTGHFWIPSCAGAPTGAPTAPYTNAAAVVADTTNSRLYVRIGTTWKYASLV